MGRGHQTKKHRRLPASTPSTSGPSASTPPESDALGLRLHDGFVRECHGDLHLGNIALVDDTVTVFDGIEFNEEMRWIDVMSEVAFTVMDLQDRRRSDLAFRFLNAYLETTGDYSGIGIFRFYLAYRAMVRAKVTAVRMRQLDRPDMSLRAEYRTYLDLTLGYTHRTHPAVIVMCGVSGSGKTTCSQALLESLGAIRLRSDVERKRLSWTQRSDPKPLIDRRGTLREG